MLASTHRLPKAEISSVLRHGTHIRGDGIELIYRKTVGIPHFSFIVSTKIDKRATQRNRMRRTMSESVRHLLPSIASMDGIFVTKKNFADLAQSDVEKIILMLLRV